MIEKEVISPNKVIEDSTKKEIKKPDNVKQENIQKEIKKPEEKKEEKIIISASKNKKKLNLPPPEQPKELKDEIEEKEEDPATIHPIKLQNIRKLKVPLST